MHHSVRFNVVLYVFRAASVKIKSYAESSESSGSSDDEGDNDNESLFEDEVSKKISASDEETFCNDDDDNDDGANILGRREEGEGTRMDNKASLSKETKSQRLSSHKVLILMKRLYF